ncbi:YdcF family protein [Zymobacter sp. IVIA_12111.31 C1]|uniref:YdcF family protein n=1 Tax=Zymobacter sp. IVIA_12111.31 C1 TaxID=3394854 RepID=UPI0039C2AA3D
MKTILSWCVGIVVLIALLGATLICVVGMRNDVQPSDVAIVLGSKVEDNGTPSVHLRIRLDRTVELYNAGMVPMIIVSGGPGVPAHPEPIVMRDYLIAHGVPASAIVLDNTGINTAATARNAVPLMAEHGFHSVIVVSEYFHVPRTRLAFAQQGIHDVHYARAGYPLPRDLLAIARETVGLPLYWLGMRQSDTAE